MSLSGALSRKAVTVSVFSRDERMCCWVDCQALTITIASLVSFSAQICLKQCSYFVWTL
jgi:hypothetical protein